MVEGDVGNSFNLPVSGDHDRRQSRGLSHRRINRDESLGATGLQDIGILAQHLRIVMMNNRYEEVFVFAERGFNAADHYTSVSIANLRRNNPDGKRTFLAQRPSEEIGTIVEFEGRRYDAILGVLRDCLGIRGVVQNCRHSSLSQSQVFSQFLESGPVLVGWSGVFRHEVATLPSSLRTRSRSTQPVLWRETEEIAIFAMKRFRFGKLRHLGAP